MANARLILTVDTTHAQDLARRVTAAIADTFAAARRAEASTAEPALIELTASAVMAEVLRLRNEATREQLAAELARLHAGEEPVTDERANFTPGQWLWMWNRATPEQRLERADQIMRMAARADACIMGDHEKRLDQQQARLTRLEAEREQARKDVESSDEAARRAMEQRQQMATERYALQEHADAAERRAGQAEDLLRVAHETSNTAEAERARAMRIAEEAEARAAVCREDAEGNATRAEQAEQRAAALERALNHAEAKAADYDEYGNRQQARAETAEHRRTELAATLHDVIRHFTQKGHPGEPCLQTGWIAEKTVAKWRAVLYPPATEEQS